MTKEERITKVIDSVDGYRLFHNARERIISHSAEPNISLDMVAFLY